MLEKLIIVINMNLMILVNFVCINIKEILVKHNVIYLKFNIVNNMKLILQFV